MANKKETRKLYKNKYFYEIIRTSKKTEVKLVGPLQDIYYCSPREKSNSTYKFVQVVNGAPVQAYTEAEILVTNKVL